jgi:DNA-binding beta-propeller fold protein YncE
MYCRLTVCVLATFCVSADAEVTQKSGGVQVEFGYDVNDKQEVRGISSADVEARFKVFDPKSAYPVAGLHPLAWFRARGPGISVIKNASDCTTAARQLVASRGNATTSTVGLNGFELITLNADDTVAILDPKINLATSNLVALIKLPGAASGWDIDSEVGVATIAMPERGKIAIVDLNRRRLSIEIPTGHGSQVLRVNKKLHQLWIANQTERTIVIAGLPTGQISGTIKLDVDVSEIGFDEKGARAWMVSEKSGQISFYDTRTRQLLGATNVGTGTVLTAYSSLASALYVANIARGEITVLYPEQARLGAKLPLGLGINSVSISPDGKFLFVLKAKDRAAALIDTSSNRILQQFETGQDPDHIGFTKNFAYIRNAGESSVTAIQLPSADNPAGTRSSLKIPMGVGQPNNVSLTQAMSPFTAIPDEEQTTLVMNPADKAVYWYMEGMMAPQNSFKTYTATPRSVLVHERGLKEVSAGAYRASTTLPGPGTYDVVFAIDSPRVINCFQAVIKGKPSSTGLVQKPLFVNKFANDAFAENVPTTLRFALKDAITKKPIRGVSDIRVLTYLEDGRYQMRGQAQAMKKGDYRVNFTFPVTGKFPIMIESGELGLRYGDFPGVFATVGAQAKRSEKVAKAGR